MPAAPVPGLLLRSYVWGGKSVQQEDNIFLLEVTQLVISAENTVSVSEGFSAQPRCFISLTERNKSRSRDHYSTVMNSKQQPKEPSWEEPGSLHLLQTGGGCSKPWELLT